MNIPKCPTNDFRRPKLRKLAGSIKTRPRPISGSRRGIRRVSARQSARNRLYKVIRDRFLVDNPICKACPVINQHLNTPRKQSQWATQVHHRKGRLGELLFGTNHFTASCSQCHRWIHDNPKKATELGLMESRK